MDEQAAPPGDEALKTAQRSGRKARRAPGSWDYVRPEYPHDIHPALVPGISVDEQRRKYSVDKIIFGVAGLLTVAFVIWGLTNPASVAEVSGATYTWVMNNLSWLFSAVASIVLFSLVALACTRYGKIPLGKDDEKPEFSTFSWVAMLFAAGLGIGVMFWGPAEPLNYFINPPPLTIPAESTEAMQFALVQTYFHWGFHAWAMYALVGGAIAYFAYRRGRTLLMSSIFRRFFGGDYADGFAGRLVDIFAIIATLFGTAAALGIAALQIGEGITIVAGVSEITNTVLALVIAVLMVGFILSAVSGVARGIRYLSNINIVLTIGIVAFVFLLGPTVFLLNLLPSATLEYLGSLFELMARSGAWGQETIDFQAAWTVYYWAWWISWSPFVGIFIARISRGRTIRQFILSVILIPSSLLIVAYGVMGASAIWMYREGKPGFSDDMAVPQVLFSVVDNLPFAQWMPYLIMVILAIFFITAADSASVVMGILTTRGRKDPPKAVVLFWGVVMGGIAMVMLLLGDETALEGLQSLVIITAVPFAVIMLLVIVAWLKELRTDPYALRRRYAENAIGQAVREGVGQYGDDFRLEVVASVPGAGASGGTDSAHEDYTEWYQRTDEHGEPVGYDFETGEWADGWDPETGTIPTQRGPSGTQDDTEDRSS
ncbi:BCCT family transporter [Enteractinococcus coprophilus]|uniref:Choline/carnitine/betaine transport n=1 Tax=Enteractinococcus coprophilus TaxID=1027633 RepID=A0A543AGB3_9MICC|nr:BCCT family transporter [Enteractinococcus coprophilus]TQL71615.1 choline/carnitine/betaine transport [Enteractinococcus coprophilus]